MNSEHTSMTASPNNKKFERVVREIEPESRLLRAWELKGGVSAQVTALEIERADGRTQKMIVRQHGEVDRKHNPQIAADEFRLLQLLQSAGLAVSGPYYLDQSGEIFSTPYIVIEYIEGKPEFSPSNLPDFISQLATHLSRIHRVDGSKPGCVLSASTSTKIYRKVESATGK
jgi:aminoglycoside phosphotransferase (APT) family kinase protein